MWAFRAAAGKGCAVAAVCDRRFSPMQRPALAERRYNPNGGPRKEQRAVSTRPYRGRKSRRPQAPALQSWGGEDG